MLQSQAIQLLCLRSDYTEADLREAYVKAVKLAHPDTSLVLAAGRTRPLAELMAARDLLMKRFEPELPDCNTCKGKGVIQGLSKFGTTCKTCQGSGRNTRR